MEVIPQLSSLCLVTVDCVKLIAEANYDSKTGPGSVLRQQPVPLRTDIKSLYN